MYRTNIMHDTTPLALTDAALVFPRRGGKAVHVRTVRTPIAGPQTSLNGNIGSMAKRKTPRKKTQRGRVTCLTCTNEPVRRGLCAACYQAAHRRIKAGDATWAQLEELKLALPAQRGKPACAWNRKFNTLVGA